EGRDAPPPPRYVDILSRVEQDVTGCDAEGVGMRCGPERNTCESNGYQIQVDDTDVASIVAVGGGGPSPEDGVNYQIEQVDTQTKDRSFLGYTCGVPGERSAAEGSAPPVIT